MKAISRHGKTAYVLFALVAVAVVLWYEVRLSLHKPFWGDEGFDLVNSCLTPFGEMILHGAQGQCSRSPLFYFLHRSVLYSLHTFDQTILVWYRLPSLAGSVLGLLTFLIAMAGSLGAAPALLGFVMFINQPIYHQFAAESRPYMVWLGTFTAFVCAATVVASRRPEKSSRWLVVAFAAAALALSTSASPGAIEICATGASMLACWFLLDRIKDPKRLLGNAFFIAGLVATLVGVYYMFASCNITDASEYDLLKTRDLGLVRYVLELLVPKGSAITWAFNALFFLGLATPALLWRRRGTLDRAERASFALGLNMLFQLGLSVLLGALVALHHHYFIQRVFIYLVACRAFSVAVGCRTAIAFLAKRVPQSRHVAVVLSVLVATVYLFHVDHVGEFLNRIDEVIMFQPLLKNEIRGIIRIQLDQLSRMLTKNGIDLRFSDYAIDYLAENGFDPQFGARPLKRLIQKEIVNPLSKRILSGNIDRVHPVLVDVFDGLVVFRNEHEEHEKSALTS